VQLRAERERGAAVRAPALRAVGAPADRLLLDSCGCQVVVPVTETSCKVFHNTGTWDRAPADPTRRLAQAKAIVEDKLVIEAQQASMHANPESKPLTLAMDRNVVRFRLIMTRLLKQEAEFRVAAE